MRYRSIAEVLQSPGLTWEDLCEQAEKQMEVRREKYRKLQAKRRMMREKLKREATMTVLPSSGETAMDEKKNERSKKPEQGAGAMEEQNEESVVIEEGKQVDSANDETSLQSEAKTS
ncbi:hypothetical protein ACHAPI_008507 [Fusarium lateritium]